MLVEIKILPSKTLDHYVNEVKLRLQETDTEPLVGYVSISAWGAALGTAVAVIARAEKEGWGTVLKIQTSHPRRRAHLLVDMCKPPDIKAEDEQQATQLHEESRQVSESLYHKDRIERIAAVFCGQLKYGARARSEIFEDIIFKQAPLKGGRPNQRFKTIVPFVKKLCGQSRLEGKKKTKADHQSLLLTERNWLEALDSKHRYGGNLKHYYAVWKDSDSIDGFFEWLDHGEGMELDLEELPRQQMESEHVKYLSIIEREAYAVKPKDGRLHFAQSGQLVNGKMIFVMGVKGQLYMGAKIRGRFHHSSFLGGSCVLVAGSADIKDGHFAGLKPHSGHYRPKSEDFDAFLRFLKDEGLAAENINFLCGLRHDADFAKKRDKTDKKHTTEGVSENILCQELVRQLS